MKSYWIFIMGIFLFTACSGDGNGYLKPRNLIEYGVPLTILAPDSVKIEKNDLVVQKELVISSENDETYDIRIYFGEADKTDIAAVKTEQLGYLKDSDIFSQVLLDEPNGFIYELSIDPSLKNYGFRRIVIQGDREYIFQTGSGIYTKEQVEEMYKATIPQALKK